MLVTVMQIVDTKRHQRRAAAHAGFALGRRSTRSPGADLPTSPPTPSSSRPPAGYRGSFGAATLLPDLHDAVHGLVVLSASRPPRVPRGHAHLPGPWRWTDDPDLAGDHVGDLSAAAARQAMAVWAYRHHDGPDLRPHLGGWIADNWCGAGSSTSTCRSVCSASCRERVPVRSRAHRRPRASTPVGLALMVIGFGAMQYVLDRGEREDWFDSAGSSASRARRVRAGGLHRARGDADHPILDFSVFGDRNSPWGRPSLAHAVRALREHAAGRALHAEAPRLRRVERGARAGAGRGGEHDLARHRGRLIAHRISAGCSPSASS